jgi:hypothetical protein
VPEQQLENIDVTVVVSGQPERLMLNVHQTLDHLVHEALQRSGNQGQASSDWELRTEDGRLLDQSLTAAAETCSRSGGNHADAASGSGRTHPSATGNRSSVALLTGLRCPPAWRTSSIVRAPPMSISRPSLERTRTWSKGLGVAVSVKPSISLPVSP